MARLEELTRDASVEGILPDGLVTVVDVKWHGAAVIELTYKDATGRPGSELLYRDREPTLEIATAGRPWSFDGDGNLLRLAKMNLTIRGIDVQIAYGDTFHNDKHPDLKADYALASPPFNDSDWSGELLKADKRWVYGVPPAGNANYAWVQHFIHHLAPTGLAGFVLANGPASAGSSIQSGEGEARQGRLEERDDAALQVEIKARAA